MHSDSTPDYSLINYVIGMIFLLVGSVNLIASINNIFSLHFIVALTIVLISGYYLMFINNNPTV